MLPSLRALIGYLLIFSTATSLLYILGWSQRSHEPKLYQRELTETRKNTQNLLTLFTAFEHRHERPYTNFAYRMAIKNWSQFMPDVRPVLFHSGLNDSLVELAADSNWDLMNVTDVNSHGVPKLKSMFAAAFEKYDSTFYGFATGDLLFSKTLLTTLRGIEEKLTKVNDSVLLVGQFKNVEIDFAQPEEIYENRNSIDSLGRSKPFFSPGAINYLIVSRGNRLNWTELADVVIWRPAYDNYFLSAAKKMGVSVVDTSNTLLALRLSAPKLLNVKNEGVPRDDLQYNTKLIGRFIISNGRTNFCKLHTRFNVFREVFVATR